jgi:membrane-bound inhibitor of C-type lysozyme
VKVFAALAVVVAGPAAAADFQTVRYACDRGLEVPATYVNADDLSVVVINVDGQQVTLVNEPAASGARYGWPSDGANYVWWTKGEEATLYWKAEGAETPLLTCKEIM